MKIVNLRETQALHGRLTKDLLARRLESGQGVGGTTLAPKKRPNGRPLGGKLPGLIRQAQVTANDAGWSFSLKDPTEAFDQGRGKGQVARHIVGLTTAERQTQVDGLKRVAVKQITARLRRPA